MPKITLTTLNVSRLPLITKEPHVFESISRAMEYAEKAEALATCLQLNAVEVRRLIRVALEDDPAISFGKAAKAEVIDENYNT